MEIPSTTPTAARVLYCHCQYAQVVPAEVKKAVLQGLCASGRPFDAVADLCEMSARKDPALQRLAGGGCGLKIVACFPRAVKGLFRNAGAPLSPETAEIINMRALTAEAVAAAILAELQPNLPDGRKLAPAVAVETEIAVPDVPAASAVPTLVAAPAEVAA